MSSFDTSTLGRIAGVIADPKRVASQLRARAEVTRLRRLDQAWARQDHILASLQHATRAFYEAHKEVREVEHQVGRYLNMKDICERIVESGTGGDVLEFGTWQGLGLILLSRCLAADTVARKLIGVDSFEGLPETSSMWRKGSFDDTSLELARRNIEAKMARKDLFTIELIRGWFDDPKVARRLTESTRKLALVHFDADLGSSTRQALTLVEPYLEGATDPVYFLFDDWGCHPDEVPDAFHAWAADAADRLSFTAHKVSSTRLTRYYRLDFRAGGGR